MWHFCHEQRIYAQGHKRWLSPTGFSQSFTKIHFSSSRSTHTFRWHVVLRGGSDSSKMRILKNFELFGDCKKYGKNWENKKICQSCALRVCVSECALCFTTPCCLPAVGFRMNVCLWIYLNRAIDIAEQGKAEHKLGMATGRPRRKYACICKIQPLWIYLFSLFFPLLVLLLPLLRSNVMGAVLFSSRSRVSKNYLYECDCACLAYLFVSNPFSVCILLSTCAYPIDIFACLFNNSSALSQSRSRFCFNILYNICWYAVCVQFISFHFYIFHLYILYFFRAWALAFLCVSIEHFSELCMRMWVSVGRSGRSFAHKLFSFFSSMSHNIQHALWCRCWFSLILSQWANERKSERDWT